MPNNQIVAHYVDGRVLKGHTIDFQPAKPGFHVNPDGPAGPPEKSVEVRLADLKAVYFVKNLKTKPHSVPHGRGFAGGRPAVGRRIRIEFKDGEVLLGTTQGYDPARPGFFVIPADTGSNNERCFVVTAATQKVSLL